MQRWTRRAATVLALAALGTACAEESGASLSTVLELREGWRIRSSAQVDADGATLSLPGAATESWTPAAVPGTVVGALVDAGRFPDAYVDRNLLSLPGMDYPVGRNFSDYDMSAESPFAVPWWYRVEFDLPAEWTGRTLRLAFGGVNYRADAWLNGQPVATRETLAGTYRAFEWDVTGLARPGGTNALAVRVQAPGVQDLAHTWVDWNPSPPDKNMGLWRGVEVRAGGPVALRWPFVRSRVPEALDEARLTVAVELHNASDAPVQGVLEGRIDGGEAFRRTVQVPGGGVVEAAFTPDEVPALVVNRPRLWWPAGIGDPVLHDLALTFTVAGEVSDRSASRFGIREFHSRLTEEGFRQYSVNGRDVLIRGAGWSQDMLLRDDPDREEAEVLLVRHLGLNTVRFEGKLGTDHLLDLLDENGILVMPGWSCCDWWEKWWAWFAAPETPALAKASQEAQIRRLRGHAGVFTWLYASDGPPTAEVEQMYLDALDAAGWPRDLALSSASQAPAPLTGPSGVKMTGPYEWVPPRYWLDPSSAGGATGFNTETGPGPDVPPRGSLQRFLSPAARWPKGDEWAFHANGGNFATFDLYDDALARRFGAPADLDDYLRKAAATDYESHRAMFEAWGRNRPRATGVILWMLNDAWPEVVWHLYDFWLRPLPGAWGAKKALEPAHIQYSYDDGTVVVVNDTRRDLSGLRATVRLLDPSMAERYRHEGPVDAPAGRSVVVQTLPGLPVEPARTAFLRLDLADAAGVPLSSNFYWLSTVPEDLDWDFDGKGERRRWQSLADFRVLQDLPPVALEVAAARQSSGGRDGLRVSVRNPSESLAFMVRLEVVPTPDADEVRPSFWEDNYVTLLPGETRDLSVSWRAGDMAAAVAEGGGRPDAPMVRVSGWNVTPFVAVPGD